jgi:CBS domain-containing protein
MVSPVGVVSEHMTASVVSVLETTSLDGVLQVLRQKDISCVLVTTSAGEPVGVVSLTDLARVSKLEGGSWHDGPMKILPPDRTAKDIMKAPLVTVPADADVSVAARTMLEHRVHRVFATRDARVVGVFSTRDALRVVLFRRVDTPLRDVMTTPVETIGVGDVIDDALAKLDETNVRGLVVVDGQAPVGLFTQLEAIRGRALPPELRLRPVEELMSYETMSLEADTPLYRAAGYTISTKMRRICVVDGRKLVGIVTGYDLAYVLAAP